MLHFLTTSHLLLHPRPVNSPVTLYSFPSKLIEYLASGTPVLSTRLKSIPIDLLPYINLSQADTPSSFFESIELLYCSSPLNIFSKRQLTCQFMIDQYSEFAFSKHFLS